MIFVEQNYNNLVIKISIIFEGIKLNLKPETKEKFNLKQE